MGVNRKLPRILHGEEEPIFQALPEHVLANLRQPASENAVLWNVLYPLGPALSLAALLAAPRLWGTTMPGDDKLTPYFWGYDRSGNRLEGLDDELAAMDGPGPKTEVDLFLVGRETLILVEAKNRSGLGACSRYQRGRCPEVNETGADACIYWEAQPAFGECLHWARPTPEDEGQPPCGHHYQLARTLLLGERLARRTGLQLHLWMFVAKRHWRRSEPAWRAFTDAVRDGDLWRRMRVLPWEALQALPKKFV